MLMMVGTKEDNSEGDSDPKLKRDYDSISEET
jgi:hypothetical protein